MPKFYWDDLLKGITGKRNVVPVIGANLLASPPVAGAGSFEEALVQRTAEKLAPVWEELNLKGEGLPMDAGLAGFIEAVRARLGEKGNRLLIPLWEAHGELLSQLPAEALPEPLRLLAQITDFPLVVTTQIDARSERAWGIPEEDAVVITLTGDTDLPEGWKPGVPGAKPTLVHLFGRIETTPGYALNEEDALEFMAKLQGRERPQQLLSTLWRSHLLLLGTGFPDWLGRFFLRVLRKDRLSVESGVVRAMADPEARPPAPLAAFVERFSRGTRIYEEGSPADFVRELHRRWLALQPQPKPPVPAVSEASLEPEDMVPGSIFISYATEDRRAAEALCAGLSAREFDTWFDGKDLRGGDNYDAKIQRHIRACDLFVPLMSRHTQIRQDAYFRREWTWARERLDGIGPERPFMMPVVIDDLDLKQTEDVRTYFENSTRKVHVLRLPDGVPTPAALEDFESAIKRVRSFLATANLGAPRT